MSIKKNLFSIQFFQCICLFLFLTNVGCFVTIGLLLTELEILRIQLTGLMDQIEFANTQITFIKAELADSLMSEPIPKESFHLLKLFWLFFFVSVIAYGAISITYDIHTNYGSVTPPKTLWDALQEVDASTILMNKKIGSKKLVSCLKSIDYMNQKLLEEISITNFLIKKVQWSINDIDSIISKIKSFVSSKKG